MDAALASHTPITDFLDMPVHRFAETYQLIAEALNRRRGK